MKKRILALFALVAMMATMLTVPVSAELIVNDTFDTPPVSGNLADVPGWTSYSDSMRGNVSFPNGALKITHTDSTVGRPFWKRTFNVPSKEFVLMLDFMMEDVGKICWQLTANSTTSTVSDKRAIYDYFDTSKLTAGVWHDIMIRSYNGGKNLSFHYKKKSDSVWKEHIVYLPELSDAWVNGLTGSYILGWDTGANNFIQTNGKGMSIDNFRVYSGDFVTGFNGFKLGSIKVENVAEVNEAGTLKAEYEVYTDDVSFVAGSAANTYELQSTAIKTIMVSFDKNMKMLDCDVQTVNLTEGANQLSNQLTISDVSTEDGYHGNISDSGYVGLYIWKGMQPFCEAMVLN